MNKKDAAKIFGENLRKLRQARGITQEELSEKLGYSSRSSINKIEAGDRDMPRSKIEQAAKILGVSPLELFKNEPLEADSVLEVIVDDELRNMQEQYEKLNDKNKMRLAAYLQALIDGQEDNT